MTPKKVTLRLGLVGDTVIAPFKPARVAYSRQTREICLQNVHIYSALLTLEHPRKDPKNTGLEIRILDSRTSSAGDKLELILTFIYRKEGLETV